MTESELKKMLGQEIEVPEKVEERIRQVCAQTKPASRVTRRFSRTLRTALAAAAAIAVLGITAGAVYVANHRPAFQAFFGNESRASTEYAEMYDEDGNWYMTTMNEERVPVDVEQAETLVGEYLSDTGCVWQIGEYTVTVENYLLDENTGTAKIYYSLKRPGGVEGIYVDGETGEIGWDGSGISPLLFSALADGEWSRMYGGKGIYADQGRSAADTLYIMEAMINTKNWSAEDGLQVEFRDFRLNQDSALDMSLVAAMELPGVESLPAVTVLDRETGETVAVFSSIGIKVRAEDVEKIDEITLTYADGSEYVVLDDAANIQNYDYALWGHAMEIEGQDPLPAQVIGQRYLHCCFNRLVDPEQVVGVTIDGQYYACGS